jgi:ribosomal protein L37E
MGRKRKPDRLSVEASKALAANMSYGKWKALQKPEKPAPPAKPKHLIEVKCQWCGKTFYQSDHRHRKYCDECKFEATHQRRKDSGKKWREEHPDEYREYMRVYMKKYKGAGKNAVSEV